MNPVKLSTIAPPGKPIHGPFPPLPFGGHLGAVGESAGLRSDVQLTPRELEVLTLLSEGLPNKLISRRLNIAMGTVKVHISNILRKKRVSTRLQAVVSAQRSEPV